MGIYKTIKTDKIYPSQAYLKEHTVRYILQCIKEGNVEGLPPPPIVRRAVDGVGYIAIDGHNLIAVKSYQGESIRVYVAESANDSLRSNGTLGVRERNQDLKDKYDSAVDEAVRVMKEDISSFEALVRKYPQLFQA